MPNTATPSAKLTLTDHDGDTVEFDCDSLINRLYIHTFKNVTGDPSSCASLDQPSVRAIIDHLNQWLTSLETEHTIKPTIINRS